MCHCVTILSVMFVFSCRNRILFFLFCFVFVAQRCSSCHIASYCSIECQTRDWQRNGHNVVCKYHTMNENIDGSFIDAIGQVGKSLKHLNLNHSFSIDSDCLLRIGQCCPNIESINFNCCNLQNDVGLIGLILQLNSSLKSISLRMNVNITDNTINAILEHCGKSLIDLDVSHCPFISHQCMKNFIRQMCSKNYLQKMKTLHIACGIGKGKWIWTVDDTIINCIINQWSQNMSQHRELSFVVNEKRDFDNLKSKLLFEKLLKIDNLTIYRIVSTMQTLVEYDIDIVDYDDPLQHSQRIRHRKFIQAKSGPIPLYPICQETWINGHKCQTLKFKH